MDLMSRRFEDMHLWETMQRVQSTDVLLGLHGAGLTNILWLPEVGSCAGYVAMLRSYTA